MHVARWPWSTGRPRTGLSARRRIISSPRRPIGAARCILEHRRRSTAAVSPFGTRNSCANIAVSSSCAALGRGIGFKLCRGACWFCQRVAVSARCRDKSRAIIDALHFGARRRATSSRSLSTDCSAHLLASRARVWRSAMVDNRIPSRTRYPWIGPPPCTSATRPSRGRGHRPADSRHRDRGFHRRGIPMTSISLLPLPRP